ncbi:MAG: sulfotransferase [Gemmatimonadota bacterium]|uniref:sulfotransferase family protein n=1 Tax=Candidatus Palauibacter scopulicola TaxID=3056741 RepID=UPI002389662E|nr:sulfotransferase [Candidatus Palauibacter scopulicola]MDE2663162.1 sulfotransferase [Candidatus Palauibacter scopulicola]
MRTSTEYDRPYRPLSVSVSNRVGRAARRFGFGGALDIGRMIAAARRRAGLSDFGDEWFLEPLEVLVDSINAEARLTPLGAAIQRARIVSALAIRLRAERVLREHPEILDADPGRILLIAGLQRTATTMLHRLLAADPGTRALSAWEVLSPVPLKGEGTGPPRRRMRQAKRAARAIGFLAPDFRAVHPMAWDAPEEDVLLLDLSFMSQAPEAAMHVPSYARWLETRDHTKCYEYMLTVLKILHWQRPGDRWVLKTPHHMEHLDVVLDVFPDVCVIQTHRDPKRSVPSFCSMVAHGRGIFSDHVDPVEIGAHWMRKIRRMMERSMTVRRGADTGVFIDVSFYDLVADPLGELRRIYGAAGIDFTEEAAAAARAVSERSGKDSLGRHVYSSASFGLDEETMDGHSAAYRREYRIPHEVVT